VAVTAIVAVSIAFSAIFPSNHTQWLELASAPINCEFAFGAFVYLVYSAGLPRLVYCTICVVLIAAGAGGYDDYSRELGWSRVSSWGVSSAGVLLLFLMLEKHISQWLGWLCRYVGDTSYSLYIFHGLAFSFVDILLKKLPWRDVPGIQIVCLCLGAGIVSNVLFVMVERPFTANAVRAWRGRFGQIKLEARAVSN
jgi:peptidoglycan/LPS O-acetylase OafA/YrhL